MGDRKTLNKPLFTTSKTVRKTLYYCALIQRRVQRSCGTQETEKEKEKTKWRPTGNAKDNMELTGKCRLFFRFYLFPFSLEQNIMAHRCLINVGRKRQVGNKHLINIDPWSPQKKLPKNSQCSQEVRQNETQFQKLETKQGWPKK